MGSLKYTLIDYIKTNNLTKPIYSKLKKKMSPTSLKMEDIQTIVPVAGVSDEVRYNLILPTLRNTKVFGGILTTIKILRGLLKNTNYKARIIVLYNENYSDKWTYKVDGFTYDKTADYQIAYAAEKGGIEVNKNDIFIFSNWRTVYSFMPVLNWQINTFQLKNRKALYLIQDYEPGFYAWSTEYVLAESTYKTDADKIIALFNSKELYDFFQNKGYHFPIEEYFQPTLNENLKKELLSQTTVKREKQILIYGRPTEHRNAFEIIKGALTIWSDEYPEASDWTIISLGEYYENIKLSNNTIEVHGKVSLEEYANIMLTSYAGISLMISPHPSYPPLEMSTFGVRTITNTFENKDLTYFSDNIISINNCTPAEIAHKLSQICAEYDRVTAKINVDSSYVKGGLFDEAVEKIGTDLYEMVNRD